jgi:hypothetical protein
LSATWRKIRLFTVAQGELLPPELGFARSPATLSGLPDDGGYLLHAQSLELQHSITGEEIHLEAALLSRFSQHSQVHAEIELGRPLKMESSRLCGS